MAENFPKEQAEKGEDERNNKLSRIQKMLASILKRERKIAYEITEDTIAAKSAIQFVSSSVVLSLQTDDEDDT
jgi:hypothetical protein